jgi:hypothetical protein
MGNYTYRGIDPNTGELAWGGDTSMFLPGSINAAVGGNEQYGLSSIGMGENPFVQQLLTNMNQQNSWTSPSNLMGLAGMGMGLWDSYQQRRLQKGALNRNIDMANRDYQFLADQVRNRLKRSASVDNQVTGGASKDTREYPKDTRIKRL